jgi:hypothetical protein
MPVPDFCIHESEGGIMGKSTAAVNESLWMPASLLQDDSQQKLANALFAASRYNEIERHFNKGLAGAPAEAIEAAKGTAMNPATGRLCSRDWLPTAKAPRIPVFPVMSPKLPKAAKLPARCIAR